MKLRTALSVILVAGAALASAAEMPWVKTWADAEKKAKEQKKLIMVDFYTEW